MPNLNRGIYPLAALLLLLSFHSCSEDTPLVELKPDQTLVLIGNNLPARMMEYGFFEAALQSAYPELRIRIRNMGDAGNTPGFRPHSGRNHPWAFSGARALLENLYPESGSEGHFETPDQWLDRLDADIILAFFGFNEVFRPAAFQAVTEAELRAFIDHTRSMDYNETQPPELVLVSPIALEPQPGVPGLEDVSSTNEKLQAYTQMMRRVALETGVPFLNIFDASLDWYDQGTAPLTQDGLQLNEAGSRILAAVVGERIFGVPDRAVRAGVQKAVMDKNWYWQKDFKIPNGVHVFGRRYDPFGPDNYPYELEKIRQMTAIRDTAIWQVAMGNPMDVATADTRTLHLPPVASNYTPDAYGHGDGYRYGRDALEAFELPPGYQIELVASEREFPELANPVQLSFDERGRLWVATMPSYPHYRPGDPRPADKLLILEDTDQDGKTDNLKVWADSLHLPVGFELSPEGVYISQGTHLKRYRDTDGDDRADESQIVFSGFDDHDTHHAISAFTADPSGAIYMGEGTFLHTNVETPYGPVRGTNGGFYRFNPRLHQLERTAQLPIPNPWGIAFDDWGQPFFLDTSGPALRWMSPGSLKPTYGSSHPNPPDMVPEGHKVRPTAGLEFVSSRHFPDSVQGDILLGNSIGFLGIKQHRVVDTGTGYRLEFRQDLLRSRDPNFRPVDMEFAPDGSLYVVDWHNILVGHMQHNARDPYRDHSHGRIYRISHTQKPPLTSNPLTGLGIPELLDQLKEPEYRTRYRVRRVLRGKDPEQVARALSSWVSGLRAEQTDFDRLRLEALWVGWGAGRLDTALLASLLDARDYRARAAAIRALRYNWDSLPDSFLHLKKAARDPEGRVRLEVLATASWLEPEKTREILDILAVQGLDPWLTPPYLAVQQQLSGGTPDPEEASIQIPDHLPEEAVSSFRLGREVYLRDGYCATCHQEDGSGLPASGFPPLKGSEWVTGDPATLIKITLKGLQGPIRVGGKEYPGQVPMTAFEGLLTDAETAAVLTYVRNAFGNQAGTIQEETVGAVRQAESSHTGFYQSKDLKP